MKLQVLFATALLSALTVVSTAQASEVTLANGWSTKPYCQPQASDDAALVALREEVAYVFMRAFPTSSPYLTNVCVYRESQAFPSGSPGSLVVTLDAENLQDLPTQPHTWSGDVTCAVTGDVPCVRVRRFQLYLVGSHVEAVRLPSAPDDNTKRVVAIVQDVAPGGAAVK